MSDAQRQPEVMGQNPDPIKLSHDLAAMDTDQKKWNHLRALFIEESEVDQYVQFLDTDEDIDLTKKQLTSLKGTLEGFKVYLKEIYLPQTGERIQSFDEKLKEVTAAFGNPEATPEELEGIGKTRRRVAQAMQIAKAPRGAKGKSLREVTQKGVTSASESTKELSPEQIMEFLGEFKTRFNALPQLHKGVQWSDVEKSLRADPESMAKLQVFDEKGHKMNVFGEENGEFIFASGWTDYNEVSADHRDIVFDEEAQKWLAKNYPNAKCNGNAVSIIANIMGVQEDEAGNYLADPKFHEQLRKATAVNGWAWLKTDAETRESGNALDGNDGGVDRYLAYARFDDGSFRAALRVKKA